MVDTETTDDDGNSRCGTDPLVANEIDEHEDCEHQDRDAEHRGGREDAGSGGERGLRFCFGHWFQPKWSRGPRPWPRRQSLAPCRAARTKDLASRVASGTLGTRPRTAHHAA